MSARRSLRLDGRWLTGAEVPEPGTALVVDSFLAADGRVLDADVHERRFVRGCAELGLGVEPHRLAEFVAAAFRELPTAGRWFPRLEVHAGDPASLVLWMRPAPPLSTQVTLWVRPGVDPRAHPTVKGPDLAVLAGLRVQAGDHGADDAVLLAADGSVVETAHSALLWWRGDQLCFPDPDLPQLPSVTARRVLRLARADGCPTLPQRCPPSALAGAEVWVVNALHGVRPVVGWIGDGAPERPPEVDRTRLARYRAGGQDALIDTDH